MTSHICNLGLYLWSNQTLFHHVALKAIDPKIDVAVTSLPGTNAEVELEDEVPMEEEEEPEIEQISDLITTTTLAPSRWLNLLDIDIIRKKNKPKDAPKVPESAPFFLPTIPSLELQFDFSDVQTAEKNDTPSIHADFQMLTPFGKILQLSIVSNDFSRAVETLKSFGPSKVDAEIRALDFPNAEKILLQFMKLMEFMFDGNRDFELSQAYLGLFLKIHGPKIAENEILRDHLKNISEKQTKTWGCLRKKLFYNLSSIEFLKKL